MDGLLKTWKEPVPGSLDTRPVFPPEAVRPIENAMIQLRTALQKQRQGQPQLAGHRNTPTPPQFNGQFGPPLHHQQMYYGHPSQQVSTLDSDLRNLSLMLCSPRRSNMPSSKCILNLRQLRNSIHYPIRQLSLHLSMCRHSNLIFHPCLKGSRQNSQRHPTTRKYRRS